ncbi:MAG TPA: DUF4249 family protein [Bacteroidales bacterium]|nr:DUF4249 family protein [Bacteroidales bacterium]
MELNYHLQLVVRAKATGNLFRKPSVRLLSVALISVVFFTLTGCEDIDRFYRPNLPEKLCSIGIIDADDTTRYISFEKSYQIEYLDELSDSLRGFSFSISSSFGDEIFSYSSDTTIKELRNFEIPDSVEFLPGETYYLLAKEDSTPEITAEITVPAPPPEINLVSIEKDTIAVSQFTECRRPFDNIIKQAIINISFYSNSKSYYALLLEGTGMNYSLAPYISGFVDFSIKESNIPGFFAVLHGLKMDHQICINNRLLLNKTPVYAYFINGSKASGNKSDIALSVKFHDGYSLFDFFTSFRVKLLSIPEELYLFEKSLYTYGKVAEDPFSEPVYLNGNIKGGNGVFAICRSTDISIILPFPPY